MLLLTKENYHQNKYCAQLNVVQIYCYNHKDKCLSQLQKLIKKILGPDYSNIFFLFTNE